MAFLEVSSEEEYLDDPIKLIDFEERRFRQAAVESTDVTVFEQIDDEDDILIEKQQNNRKLPSLGKGPITLPGTFFEIPNNIHLLNQCQQLSVKLVNCKETARYKKTFKNNDEEVDFYSQKNKDNKMVEERKKIKIRPVVSPYRNLVESPQPTNAPKSEKSLSREICSPKNYEPQKNSVALEKGCNPHIDFKKNQGLIGMKITQTQALSEKDVQKTATQSKSKLRDVANRMKKLTKEIKKASIGRNLQDANKITDKKTESSNKPNILIENVINALDAIQKKYTVAASPKKDLKSDQDSAEVYNVLNKRNIVDKNLETLSIVSNKEVPEKEINAEKLNTKNQNCISKPKVCDNKSITKKAEAFVQSLFFPEKKIEQTSTMITNENAQKTEVNNYSSKLQGLNLVISKHGQKTTVPNKIRSTIEIFEVEKDKKHVNNDVVDKSTKKKVSRKRSDHIKKAVSQIPDKSSSLKLQNINSKVSSTPTKKSNKVKNVKQKKSESKKKINKVKEQNIKDDSVKKGVPFENVELPTNKIATDINCNCNVQPISNEPFQISNNNAGKQKKKTQSSPQKGMILEKHIRMLNQTKDSDSLTVTKNQTDKKYLLKQQLSNGTKLDIESATAIATAAPSAVTVTQRTLMSETPTSAAKYNSKNTFRRNSELNNEIPLHIPIEQKRSPKILKITRYVPDLAVNNLLCSSDISNLVSSNSSESNVLVNKNLHAYPIPTVITSKKNCSENKTVNSYNTDPIPSVIYSKTNNQTKKTSVLQQSYSTPNTQTHPIPCVNNSKTNDQTKKPSVLQQGQSTPNMQTHPIPSVINSKINNQTKKPVVLQQGQPTPNTQIISNLNATVQQASRKTALPQLFAPSQEVLSSSGHQLSQYLSQQQKTLPTVQVGCHLQAKQYRKNKQRMPPTCDIATYRTISNKIAPNMTQPLQQQLSSRPPHVISQPVVPNLAEPIQVRQHQQNSSCVIPNVTLQQVVRNPADPRLLVRHTHQLPCSVPFHVPLLPGAMPFRAYPRQQSQANFHVPIRSGEENNPHSAIQPNFQLYTPTYGQGFQHEFANFNGLYSKNSIHCAPVYNVPANINTTNSMSCHERQNYWEGLYNSMPFSPTTSFHFENLQKPEQRSNQMFMPCKQPVEQMLGKNSSFVSNNISGTTIIGCNEKGPVRKINLVCEPLDISAKNPNDGEQAQLPKQAQPVKNAIDSLENKSINRNKQQVSGGNMMLPACKPNIRDGKKSAPHDNGKKIPSDKQIVSSKREMLEELSKLTTIESSGSCLVKDLKRPLPKDDNKEKETVNPHEIIKRPKPGPLSRKPKFITEAPIQNIQASIAHKGYSPPILPIPSYEKTLELLAKSNIYDPKLTDPIGKGDEKVILNTPHVSEAMKRASTINEKQDKSAKKITLDEYKRRTSKPEDKSESGLNGCDLAVNNIKVEIKTENTEDLGYGSDSAAKL